MKAIAITPGKGDARLIDINEPSISSDNEVKLKVVEVGICGTDREEAEGGRADAPAGESRLVIGHEMLGTVVETGSKVKSVRSGDYALFMVRRPCGKCEPCRVGRSDLCTTGDYTERGIKGRHGFQSEFVVDSEEYLIRVPGEIAETGVLTEPMSVVEKAIDEAVILQSARLPGKEKKDWLRGRRALVAGLGPIGLLAAFILKLQGAEIFGLDIVDESSPRPGILRELGGEYINGNKVNATDIDDKYGMMDFIVEATGVPKLEFQLIDALGINGIYVLTGIPSGERMVSIAGAALVSQLVLMNQLMLGSVNASKVHYEKAVEDLRASSEKYGQSLRKLITSRIHVQDFYRALTEHTPDEIKTVITW
ncbi:MAG TPA: glucose 1-dehydrogenase [Bacteroidales bacterium]|nr:glucose 1-dehydrogenase [Bacteroidales bacterium]